MPVAQMAFTLLAAFGLRHIRNLAAAYPHQFIAVLHRQQHQRLFAIAFGRDGIDGALLDTDAAPVLLLRWAEF